MPLTARAVAALKRPGFHADGGGLYIQVTKSGGKSWVFRFRLHGRDRWMGLGSIADVELADARESARAARALLAKGLDPITERKAREAAAGVAMTFQEAAEAYIDAHRPGWKNEKHAAQWPATLKTYVYPKIGDLKVGQVGTDAVLSVLQPIWSEIPESAGRIRGRIEAVLDWAKARGQREGENPARWKGHLANLLPARNRVARIQHHPAMPYNQLGAFMARLRALDGIAPRALEFTILTASRTNEAIGARWDEIDLAAKVWVIPGERMKGKREHRVPLSDRAIEIIQAMKPLRESAYVFPGRKRNAPPSNMAMLKLLERMKAEVTTHGFRSTFRDWAGDMTSYPNHVCEMALAHAIGDKVEASYRRSDLFEKRRRLMADWARYCAKTASGSVVAINRKTAG